MTKVKGFVCAEMTADGPRQFAVDSEETFDAYVQLSDWGSSEADHWGGFQFSLDPEDSYDADGEELDSNNLAKCQVITMAEINAATAGIDEDEDEHDEEAYENAFLIVRDGAFREE